MLQRQAQAEIERVSWLEGVQLHLIPLQAEPDPGFWNFDCAERLIAAGRGCAQAYLRELQALSESL